MAGLDLRIVKFIKRHHVLTLATLADGAEGELWACNLFYAYYELGLESESGSGSGSESGLESRPALVFTSDSRTEHATQFTRHPRVAGSIVLETKMVAKVQGLQLQGTICRGDVYARTAYLKRFPYAVALLKDVWTLELSRLKFTDNALGFGTKLYWPSP